MREKEGESESESEKEREEILKYSVYVARWNVSGIITPAAYLDTNLGDLPVTLCG